VFRHGVSARDFDETNSHVNDNSTDVHTQYVTKALVQNKADLVTATGNATPARLAVGSNGQVLVADSSQTTGLRWIDGQTQKNGLQNGSMVVAQRGTSAVTLNASAFLWPVDRWKVARSTGSTGVTAQQQTSGPTGFRNSLRCQRTNGDSSTGDVYLLQNLETVNSYQFAGQSVTLSFWARCGANYSAASSGLVARVYSGTGTDETGYGSGWAGTATVVNQTATLTTSWQRFSYTGSVGSTATQLQVFFAETPVGTAGANDWFEITGVQLEVGPVATPFEFEPYEATLRKCQRYYLLAVIGTSKAFANANYYTSTNVRGVYHFPAAMRIGPSMVVTTGTDNYTFQVNGGGDSFNTLAILTTTEHQAGFEVSANVSGTAGLGGWIYTSTADASIAFSAEL
jgi:hypothetical protein